MGYEKFKAEVERILKERAEPIMWKEIKEASTKLKQKAPYHVYVQKLQGDIGLVRFKSNREKKTVWALREWFEEDKFKEILPERLKLIILSSQDNHTIGIDEHWTLKRIYPLKSQTQRRWDVIQVKIEEYFPRDDKRPESIRIKKGGRGEESEIEHLRKIEKDEEKLKIAEKISESGEFLHTDAWKGKTLGVTKPRFRCFYFYDTRCQFFCDKSVCVGHDMEVTEKNVAISDKVFFLLEAAEKKKASIWGNKRIEWAVKSVISLSDPKQRRLL